MSGGARPESRRGTVELGIVPGEFVNPGDHIACLWETEADFRRAVRFLTVGLRRGDYGVVFGHPDANARVLAALADAQIECAALLDADRLAVVEGEACGARMLAGLTARFRAARARGAPLIRLLGNLGWGRPGWPGDADLLRFEASVTDAVRGVPAVVVCLYDVRGVSGEILLRGAIGTHRLTIWRNLVRENPHYVPVADFVAELAPRPVD